MSLPDKERWTACWRSVGGAGDPEGWYGRLAAAYGEPHRHYHNGQHIAACLSEFDHARHLAREPAAVELALWFHDAVYDPKAGDNEERSAEMAGSCLSAAGLPKPFIERVGELVRASKCHAAEADSDEAVMVDVDLSILGQDEKRFAEYEEQIRREYAWVPARVFASKRAEILESFLAREHIFHTELFRERYEASARRNLAASIANLKRSSQYRTVDV
jgi:predicted metal-dependent HD superfamily phosphohydrolase